MCEHDSECIGDTAFGRTITVIRMVMSLAESGGMTIARSDAVTKEIIEAIENTDGQLCECGDCTNRIDLEMGCEGWLDGVQEVLDGRNEEIEEAGSPEEMIKEVFVLLWQDAEIGLLTDDEIVLDVVEMLSSKYPEDELRSVARRTLPEVVEALVKEQASRPDVTDCDRLDAAFSEMNEAGIVCRQHFTCCSTCGHSGMWREVDAEGNSGLDVRGYAFYHAQDTDSAMEGNGLWVGHGSVLDDEDANLRIAGEIVDCLRRHGLDASWSGGADKRIEVKMDWKRRIKRAG